MQDTHNTPANDTRKHNHIAKTAFLSAQNAVSNEHWHEAAEILQSLTYKFMHTNTNATQQRKNSCNSADTSEYCRDIARLLAEALYLNGQHQDSLRSIENARRLGWLDAHDPCAATLHGWILLRRGQARPARDLAKRHLRKSVRTLDKIDLAQQARTLHLLGMCEHRLGKPRPARQALCDAAAIFRLSGDDVGASEALNALGLVEKNTVSLTAASIHLEEALRLFTTQARPGRRAQTLLNLGIVKLKCGHTSSALRLLSEADILASNAGQTHTILRIHIALAHAHIMADKLDTAHNIATAAFSSAARGAYSREEALCLETLGDIALARGDLEEAKDLWTKGLALARRIAPGGDLEVGLARRQASLLYKRKMFVEAIISLRRAVKAAIACGEHIEEGLALHDLALTHLSLEQWDLCSRAIQRALTVLRAVGAELDAARCLLSAAQIHCKWWQAMKGKEHIVTTQKKAIGHQRSQYELALRYGIEALQAFRTLEQPRERSACEALMKELRAQHNTVEAHSLEQISDIETDRGQRDGIGIVAGSRAMRKVIALADIAASCDEPVLITGETGTGKELIARLIHSKSQRRNCLFVPVNCAAVPEALFEREFFGHTKGAYTGADKDGEGYCGAADGGTLFLDEIGAMPIALQAKLLRVLQERTFRRLGEAKELHTNLRIIGATNADLNILIRHKQFRDDLYYRLQTLNIMVPALRDRMEDLRPLIALFIERIMANREKRGSGGEAGKKMGMLEQSVIASLSEYDWPGNVRELEAVVRRIVLCAGHASIEPGSVLPVSISARSAKMQESPGARGLAQYVRDAERARIVEVLAKVEGNRTHAARVLCISRNALYRKMEKLGLSVYGKPPERLDTQ